MDTNTSPLRTPELKPIELPEEPSGGDANVQSMEMETSTALPPESSSDAERTSQVNSGLRGLVEKVLRSAYWDGLRLLGAAETHNTCSITPSEDVESEGAGTMDVQFMEVDPPMTPSTGAGGSTPRGSEYRAAVEEGDAHGLEPLEQSVGDEPSDFSGAVLAGLTSMDNWGLTEPEGGDGLDERAAWDQDMRLRNHT
ncbi:hypothetical protein BDW22DRAFT_1425902 [Trametopsis cervina]|nr:hypothetical protein BDW22DRAFT_1425902 [Trametopsis cervina]